MRRGDAIIMMLIKSLNGLREFPDLNEALELQAARRRPLSPLRHGLR